MFLALVASACAQEPPRNPIAYSLDGGGLALLQSDLRVDFGRTEESTRVAMNKLEGAGPVAEGDCAALRSYATWPSGISLIFEDQVFVDWAVAGSDPCGPMPLADSV